MQISVLMGGPSAEYEISIKTGIEVIRHLIGRNDYKIQAVVLSKHKQFFYSETLSTVPDEDDLAYPEKLSILHGPVSPANSKEIWDTTDIVFLALHGEFGEDGRIQGYFDVLGIRYTGSGVYASSVGMNKIATKQILIQQGISTPPFSIYKKNGTETVESLIEKHGLPCFVKCPQSGSSKLLGRAKTKEQLSSLLRVLTIQSSAVLVEQSVTGIEMSCGVIEMPDGSNKALPPVEIRPRTSEFFDFTAKYGDDTCEELVPAPQPEQLLSRIQDCALQVHSALHCRGISRTDFIVQNDILYILEINTLPGLTKYSLVPKCFAAQGGTYPELLDILIASANRKKV